MDAFFASVEQLDNPDLRGKPVLVGGTGNRGVVAAASYEARAFGCRSAQPTVIARRLCPHAIIVRGNYTRYKELSNRVFTILESATPLVQPISIDEAFCDVSGSTRLLGEAEAIARSLKARIKADTGLTASVGVAPNKYLAKLASDLRKPDGLVVITPETIQSTLDPLPVSRIWGVGPSAERTLSKLGVRTIRELRGMPEDVLTERFGSWGLRLWQLARGIDDRPVVTDHAAKSISHEQTFGEDLTSPDDVRAVIAAQAEQVARRLRRANRRARGIVVKIRYGDFETITRNATLGEPTDTTLAIADAARALFDAWASANFRPVRLIGTGVQRLTEDTAQPGLFDQAERVRTTAVDRAADVIAAKFGAGAIQRAASLGRPSPRVRDHGDSPHERIDEGQFGPESDG